MIAAMRPVPFILALLILVGIDRLANGGAAADGFLTLLDQGIRFILHVLRLD
jgi:hypothetical protein